MIEYFDDIKRLLYDGVILPSVGTIIKPIADTYYTEDIPEWILNKAKARGSAVHLAIEGYLSNGYEVIEKSYEGYFKAFLTWLDKSNAKILEYEKVVYTSRFWGITDLIIELDSKIYVVDIKTSSKLLTELVSLQTTGYKICYQDMGNKVDGALAIHLTKTGKYQVHLLEDKTEQFNELLEKHEEEK